LAPKNRQTGLPLIKPFGGCREILPQLGRFDLLLTDPPYGIKRAKGMCGGGISKLFKTPRKGKRYAGSWDNVRPDPDLLRCCLASADAAIVWGGNYFSDVLPVKSKWLVWDKIQTMAFLLRC
jgi:DNA modification methylase